MEHNADFDYIEHTWRTDYIWSSETTGGNDYAQGDSFKIRCLLRDHYICLEGEALDPCCPDRASLLVVFKNLIAY